MPTPSPKAAAVAFAGLIAVTLLAPADADSLLPAWLLPAVAVGLDKVVHFGLFVLQSWLAVRGWPERPRLAAAVAAAYGIALEVAQSGVPTRGFDPWDAVADIAGVAVGLVGARRWPHLYSVRSASRGGRDRS